MDISISKLINSFVLIVTMLLGGACRLLPPVSTPPEPDTVIDSAPTSTLPEPTPAAVTSQPTEPSNTGGQIAPFSPGQTVMIDFIDMEDETTGWAIGFVHNPGASQPGSEDHILRTRDGGRTWLDVSPPETIAVPPSEYDRPMRAAGFFLDENTAWVTFEDFDQVFNFRLWRTSDGGQTWELSEFIKEDEVWDSLVHWQFIDADQGWAMLGGGVAAGSSPVTLLHTPDGGRTWETLSSGGTGEGPLYSGQKTGMHFLDEQNGLITITDPSPHPSTLWTHDGGHTWESQVVVPPDNAPPFVFDFNCTASQPLLFSPSSAALTVRCQYAQEGGDYQPQTVMFVTGDGGASWQILASPQKVLDYFNTQAGFTLNQAQPGIPDAFQVEKIASLVTRGPSEDSEEQISFVNENVGWKLAKQVNEENYETTYSLFFTSDGGATWQPLNPTIIAPDS